ncbi:MAG: diphthine--ammonia ligase [Thermoplasmatota archaeon]
MRVCCLFSGGKDSSYSLHRMLLSGFEVPVLLTVRSSDPDSWLYQTPGIEISHLFPDLTGIETEILDSPADRDREREVLTARLIDMKERFRLDAVCTGALLSDYQRMIFSHAAFDAGLISYTPIWRKDGIGYLNDLVGSGFEFILLSYSSEGFDPGDLGRIVDDEMKERFLDIAERWRSHPAFEGGEAETLVLSAPLYRKRLEIRGEVRIESEFRARYMIREARCV